MWEITGVAIHHGELSMYEAGMWDGGAITEVAIHHGEELSMYEAGLRDGRAITERKDGRAVGCRWSVKAVDVHRRGEIAYKLPQQYINRPDIFLGLFSYIYLVEHT